MYDRSSMFISFNSICFLSKPPQYVPQQPPFTPFTIPSTSQASTSSKGISTQQSLIEKYKLQDAVKRGLIPSEPPKKWEASAEKRQELLQWKKDAMVLQAREYVKFYNLGT